MSVSVCLLIISKTVMSVSVCLLIISKTMKLRYKLILMNILIERLINRSMNLQSRPSPTI